MSTLSPRQEELLSRLDWFVRLRWLFLLALGFLLLISTHVFDLVINLRPILIVALAVLLYNLGFLYLHRILRPRWDPHTTVLGIRVEANLQIGLDLFSLVLLIHFSGGIENPFIFFFVFHMIMGSILLSGLDMLFQAVGTLFLLFLLLALAYFDIIRHYRIEGFASPDLWSNIPYICAGAVSFGATILLTVYMTSSISRSVRHREEELFSAKTLLEKKSMELERANFELIRQQSLLVQSEKLASLGKLSAGIAHELNSPLTGVLSFSHFIKDAYPEDEQIQHDIGVVIRETGRCKKIIVSLLDFARQSEPEKRLADVSQILNRTIGLVENHKDFRNIEIIRDFDHDLPALMVDHDQIQQVFMNMIVNAQEAMEGNGTLYVRAKKGRNPSQLEVIFKDTGSGIAKENLNRIFDPFFTTKEMGTGLGLSISVGIIANHGGILEVSSEIGKGTSFIIKLPANHEKPGGE